MDNRLGNLHRSRQDNLLQNLQINQVDNLQDAHQVSPVDNHRANLLCVRLAILAASQVHNLRFSPQDYLQNSRLASRQPSPLCNPRAYRVPNLRANRALDLLVNHQQLLLRQSHQRLLLPSQRVFRPLFHPIRLQGFQRCKLALRDIQLFGIRHSIQLELGLALLHVYPPDLLPSSLL